MEVGTKVQVQPRAFDEDIKVPRIGKVIDYPYGNLDNRKITIELEFPTSFGNRRVFDKLFVNEMN